MLHQTLSHFHSRSSRVYLGVAAGFSCIFAPTRAAELKVAVTAVIVDVLRSNWPLCSEGCLSLRNQLHGLTVNLKKKKDLER